MFVIDETNSVRTIFVYFSFVTLYIAKYDLNYVDKFYSTREGLGDRDHRFLQCFHKVDILENGCTVVESERWIKYDKRSSSEDIHNDS